jgi:hypothetical protein
MFSRPSFRDGVPNYHLCCVRGVIDAIGAVSQYIAAGLADYMAASAVWFYCRTRFGSCLPVASVIGLGSLHRPIPLFPSFAHTPPPAMLEWYFTANGTDTCASRDFSSITPFALRIHDDRESSSRPMENVVAENVVVKRGVSLEPFRRPF